MDNVGKLVNVEDIIAAMSPARRARIRMLSQGLLNNLCGNNPGELERWADDGGYEGDASEQGLDR